jgi:hypothetical protein
MSKELHCYGKVFPSVLQRENNREIRGQVFNYRIDWPGMAVTSRTVTVGRDPWAHCVVCSEFDPCYRLSTETMLLESSLNR